MHHFKTPILFLTYKRIETTKKVFEQIKKIKPQKLYIASDGPKDLTEEKEINEVRNYILNEIDWNCEVKTLFRDKNLGCGKAVSNAINWFFENEKEGIILEDDTLPSNSFFEFCSILLEKYRNENKIWHIGGINLQNGIIRGNGSYYFSAFSHIYGWATWQNKWCKYDFYLSSINNDSFISNYWSGIYSLYWKRVFKNVKKGIFDAWSLQWLFTVWYNNGLCILPNYNLVSHIGILSTRKNCTLNEKNFKNLNKELYEIDTKNLIHPTIIERNIKADIYTMKYEFNITPLKLVIGKISRFFKEKFLNF